MLNKISGVGTSYQGEIEITYAELVAALGEPHMTMGDKTTAEWAYELNGVAFTIYDWQGDYANQTPTGVYDWHIGGNDEKAVETVQHLFPRYKVSK